MRVAARAVRAGRHGAEGFCGRMGHVEGRRVTAADLEREPRHQRCCCAAALGVVSSAVVFPVCEFADNQTGCPE